MNQLGVAPHAFIDVRARRSKEGTVHVESLRRVWFVRDLSSSMWSIRITSATVHMYNIRNSTYNSGETGWVFQRPITVVIL